MVLRSHFQISIVLMVLTMVRQRLRLKVVAGAAPADVKAFVRVKGSGITLMVAYRVAEVEMKTCRTLVIQPSADICVWTATKAHLCGEGKCYSFLRIILLKRELKRVCTFNQTFPPYQLILFFTVS